MTLMDVKKTQNQKTATSGVSAGGIKNFVGDVKDEVHRITWTDKEELKAYTQIVVIATFLFGMGIFGIDLLIQTALEGLNNILTFLIG